MQILPDNSDCASVNKDMLQHMPQDVLPCIDIEDSHSIRQLLHLLD